MLPARDWIDMTAADFAGADTGRWIAVLPLAAIEQHGPHLPLGTDLFIGDAHLALARELLPAELPVTFLPVQAIGKSVEHQAFPGTLTLTTQTQLRVLAEIGASLHRAGLRKLVLVTSHGGNWPVMDAVATDLRARFAMLVVTASWHRLGYPPGLFADAEREHGLHGGEIETSLLLAARKAAVRHNKVENFSPATLQMARDFAVLRAIRPAGFGWMSQDLHPAGAIGDAAAASAEKGAKALAHAAQRFVALLEDVDRFDPARLAPGPLGGEASND